MELHAELEDGLLAGLLYVGLDLFLGLGGHLLDAGRVDAPVQYQPVQGDACDLPADGVEAGNRHGLRRIVDDEVDAGGLLEGADVAALAPDQPAFHLVVGQRHSGDGGLGDDLRGAALDGRGQYLLRPLAGLILELGLPLVQAPRSLLLHLDLHGVQQCLFGLGAGHAGDELKLLELLVL